MNPFGVRRRVLETDLEPDTCQARLGALRAGPFAVFPSAERPVSGRVGPSGFTLRRSIPYRNPYQTQVVGTFLRTPGGTRVDLRFGVARSVVVASVLWAGWWLVLAGAWIAVRAAMPGEPPPSEIVVPVAVATGALVLQALVVALGRFVARREEALLARVIEDALAAREVSIAR